MNSTADIPDLNLSAISDIYKGAGSLNYLSGNDITDKLTIFSELKKQPQRYWIVKQINKGGIKRILNARDNSTGRNIAMAVLQDSQNIHYVENFLREARVTAYLQHPNIMPVYDIGLNSLDQPYFTMKLVENGKNLDKIIQNYKIGIVKNSFELNDRIELFLKICDAVAYAHSKGVVHLDLKPANIQIDDFGELLVCDWGLAVFGESGELDDSGATVTNVTSLDFLNLTLNGVVKGTPGYMAPEQAAVETALKDHRTDIYSLGAILYSMLSLQMPIRKGKVKAMLTDTVNGKIIPLRKFQKKYNIPESLIKVVQKAMNNSPDKRYQSVEEMSKDLRAYSGGFTTSVEKTSLIKEFYLFYKRHKTLYNMFLIGCVMITIISSLFLTEINRRKEESLNIAQKAEESEQQLLQSLKQLELEKIEKIELKKISAFVYLDSAVNFYKKANYKEARSLFLKVVINNPHLSKGWKYLARLSFRNQDFEQAAAYLQKSIETEEDYTKRITLTAMAMAMNRCANSKRNDKEYLNKIKQLDSIPVNWKQELSESVTN